MGRVSFSTRAFYDATSEHIGIKSGLLLNRFQIRKILLEKYHDEFLSKDDLDGGVRLRVDELENMFVTIRRKIGNLPLIPPTNRDLQKVTEYVKRTGDWHSLATSTSVCYFHLQTSPYLSGTKLALILTEKEGFPAEIALSLANLGIERFDQNCITIPQSKEWDGLSKLSDLFDCEIHAENEHDFIDQKFLDYLAVNGNEIESIHWRNFEKFCAEYFKRQGRKVVLGPGRNDGGIDLRVYDPNDESKPLILVQCKRYKEQHKVTIETVKAFYTDVLHEDAKSGLIATSSHIASGGKKIRDTRNYNLDFAERDKIRRWATQMWRFEGK